jgi:GNAT superfamily N-acetyltransferase
MLAAGNALADFTSGLVVAAAGSLVTVLAGVSSRYVRNRRLRRRFPVAGEYLTEYEDEEDGQQVVHKAVSTLKQKGREVTGVTTDLDSLRRGWLLKGTVEPGGLLQGFYEAEDPNDPGTGTFFLKVDVLTKDLKGQWVGYGANNGSIEKGRYDFKRRVHAAIRRAEDSEAAAVCGLLGDALGDRYVQVEDVRRMIRDADSACFVALNGEDRLCGAVTARLTDRDELREILPSDQRDLVDRLSFLRYHERVCLVRSIAVPPEYRQRGVGTELVKHVLAWAATQRVTGALAIGWKPPSGCAVAGVMNTCGFAEECEVEGFWTHESETNDSTCPSCGDFCRCSAVVFTRRVDFPLTGRRASRLPLRHSKAPRPPLTRPEPPG